MSTFARRFGDLWLGLATVLLTGTVLAVLCQIGFRYVLGLPLSWTEELARLLLVTSVYAALPAAYVRGEQIVVDLFVAALPDWLRRPYLMVLKAIVVFVCGYIAAGAALQVGATTNMTFISMPWLTVAIVYAVQAAAMASMAFVALLTWRDETVYLPADHEGLDV